MSADDQVLTRQASIIEATKAAGYYVAGVYAEKASVVRAATPERLRLVADLQDRDAVVAERIDRISSSPLHEAQLLIAAIHIGAVHLRMVTHLQRQHHAASLTNS